jgi:hypothetical protein
MVQILSQFRLLARRKTFICQNCKYVKGYQSYNNNNNNNHHYEVCQKRFQNNSLLRNPKDMLIGYQMDVLFPSFSYMSPSTTTDLRQREPNTSVPFLYQFECCTRSHFCTSAITSSSLSNLSPRMTTLGIPRRWKSEAARNGLHGGWERTALPSPFIHSCVFGLVCGRSFSC